MLLIEISAQGSLSAVLVKTVLNAVALMGAAYLLKGVEVTNFTRALIAAVVLAVANATIGAVLDFFTLPLRWITLGLFSFVVDAVVLVLSARFIDGFAIKNFWTAILLAVALAIFNSLLYAIAF